MKKLILSVLVLAVLASVFPQENNVIIYNDLPQNAFYITIDGSEERILVAPKCRIELFLESGEHCITIVDTFSSLFRSDRMPQLIQPAYNFRTLTTSIDAEAINCFVIKAHFGDLYITPAASKKSAEEIRAKYKLSDPLYLETITPRDSYLFFTVQYFFEHYFMALFNRDLDFSLFDRMCPFSLDIGYRITLSEKNGILGEIRASSITFVDNARTLIGCFGSLTFLKIPFLLTPFRTIGLGIMNEVYGGIDSGSVRISLDILPAIFLETEVPLSISRDIIYSYTTKLLFIYEKDYFYSSYDSPSTHFPLTIYSGFRFEY